MRQVKCRNCNTKQDINKAYLYMHMTKSGNKQNRYYCTEDCFNREQQDIYMLKQCQYWVDDLFGYIVINNQKNKSIKELIDAGYTRQEVYECMKELENTIIDSLNYKKIDDEYSKIQYVFAIIKSKIREVTLANRNVKNNINMDDVPRETEIIPTLNINKKKPQRLGLMDIL